MRYHVIGLGRWGKHLSRRLASRGLASVTSQSAAKVEQLRREFPSLALRQNPALASLDQNDMLVLCIPDDALAAYLADLRKAIDEEVGLPLVVLSAGSASLEQLRSVYPRIAVLWPIQSFTKNHTPDWVDLPIVCQSVQTDELPHVLKLASLLSERTPILADRDETRLRLHLCAVLVQNFSNLLWRHAERVLDGTDVHARELIPLARTHLSALQRQSARALQTGPAARSDQSTLSKHLQLLDELALPDVANLYRLASAQIAALDSDHKA